MKYLLMVMLLTLGGLTAKSQYPNPLPSTPPLSMSQVITWMTASGELSGSSPPYTLLFLSNRASILQDPVRLSNWLGYSVSDPVQITTGTWWGGTNQVSQACSESSIMGSGYIEHGKTLAIGVTIYSNSSLTVTINNVSFKTFIVPYPNRVVTTNSSGVVTAITTC